MLCAQEIANQSKVDQFLTTESEFKRAAFRDSKDAQDSQDNAIFVTADVGLDDLPKPQGFQHPAQATYLFYRGFDAVVITVHLFWMNVEKLQQEKLC